MKAKTRIITILAVISIAITLSCIPALAAGVKWTKTTMYWYVLGADEIRVTLVSDSSWTVANSTGNLTSTQLNFTCPTASCQWVNVSTVAASTATQSDNTPALKIDNAGTTTALFVNISVNVTLPGSAPADCFKLRYVNDTDGDAALDSVPAIGDATNLGTTNVTIKSNMVPFSSSLRVWLFGNFSNCQTQTYPMELYVWSNT